MRNRPNSLESAPSPRLYSVKDACRRLNIGKTLLYVLVTEGKLRAVKIGSRTLFDEEELERFIESLASAAA